MRLRGPIVLTVRDGRMISHKCTKCGAELASPSGMAGQEEACPECGTICVVPEEVPVVPEEVPDPIAEEPIPDGVVDSPDKVHKWLKRWKKELPEVESAYVPSGKASVAGVLWMLSAVPLGAVAGAIVGGGSGALVGGLFGGLPFLLWARIGCLGCATVFAVIGGILGLAAGFSVAGFAAGTLIAIAGAFGKNRSPTTAAVFGIISSLVLLAVVWWWTLVRGDLPVDAGRGWVITALVIGSLLAVGGAGAGAVERVGRQKFCESCKRYLKKHKLPKLSYVDTVKAVRALGDGQMEHATRMMREQSGKRGIPTAHICPQCGNGYIEISIKFEARCKKSGKDEKWLVCSVAVESSDAAEFLRLKERA